MLREWIIFALCLGSGGHIALAVVLHAPERWPWPRAGMTGVLVGLGLYVVVQLVRVAWRRLRPSAHGDSDESDDRDVLSL